MVWGPNIWANQILDCAEDSGRSLTSSMPVTARGVVPGIPQVTDSLKRGQLLSMASTRLFGRMSVQFASIHARHSLRLPVGPIAVQPAGTSRKAGHSEC